MAAKATLEIGQELVAPYKGETFEAKVEQHEGKAVVVITHGNEYAPQGMVFTSLSAAGQALTQKKACQGPRFWRSKDRGSNAAAQPANEPVGEKPKRAAGFKNIRKTPNQLAVAAGQTRFFCSACMKSFVSEAKSPDQCPEGHAAIMLDLEAVG